MKVNKFILKKLAAPGRLVKLCVVVACLLASSAVSAQQLKIKAIDKAPENYVKLEWYWEPSSPAGTFGFTLYQWDSALSTWQTTSTNYDKQIKVLNVYPNVPSPPAGKTPNSLKSWMETDVIEGEIGAGKGKILVDAVDILVFNANPATYMKDGGGKYKYDAIFFGSWDCNGVCGTYNNVDISVTAKDLVEDFLKSGRGVLFGHDTQTSLGSVPGSQKYVNFTALRNYTNLYIDLNQDQGSYRYHGTQVKAINDGFLLKYPWTIAHNSILTIPQTHSTGQLAKGVIWMEFYNGSGTPITQTPASDGSQPCTNNFYLTTWNNAAMIQTGHSSGAATNDEKKIIANTLWYLAQFTTETNADVRSARDEAKPDTPTASRNTNDNSKISIKSKDNGTTHKFKVKGTKTTDYNVIYESNELSVVNKTGLKGYYISESCSPTGTTATSGEPTLLASDNVEVTYTVKHKANYVHIAAVDHAGNVSGITTIAPALTPAQDFMLTCLGMGKENYIKLTWDPSTLDGLCGSGSGSYRYTIFQWDNALSSWQSVSASYNNIKVLNVYPDIGNNLKSWMETGGATGIGKGKISVDEVSITNFNANPNAYLKSGADFKYDVIMFGSWNVNNKKDISVAARDATEEFLKTGRGVMFGHDVPFRYDYPEVHDSFLYLAEKYLNMNFSYIGTDGAEAPGKIKTFGGTQVKAIRKGFLLEYPWTIAHNSVLTIPQTHSSAQLAKGIVWMNFHNPAFGKVVEDFGGTNDFYLTTWNNTAMIQTGHSNGAATDDEKKIIANTLWYLAQFTTETSADMKAAQDKATPDIPTASRDNSDNGIVNIKSKDNGTTYRYYVQATDLADSDFIKKTNETECTVTTGVKGYYIMENCSATGTPDTSGEPILLGGDGEEVAYTVKNKANYVHIIAVDHAGNLSGVRTLEPAITPEQDFLLTCLGMGKENYIKLTWDPSSLDGLCGIGSGSYSYTIYQWDEAISIWQPTSPNMGKKIKVLNPYPSVNGNNTQGNTLKAWMEQAPYNAGLGNIEVTPVTLANFNADPDSYLKSAGEYQYDAVFFGSWDRNGVPDQDISVAGATAIDNFLKTGRGVLFGHDTQTGLSNIGNYKNFVSLADWTNLHINLTDQYSQYWVGSKKVKSVNDGYLLKYPHTIPYNAELSVPYTHSTGQFAKGIIWMQFVTAPGTDGWNGKYDEVLGGGHSNFYLTTWNNAAMIQTGHSNGAATQDEANIIANTLWYLAQFTTESQADIRSALDLEPPVTPAATRDNNSCNKVNISSWDEGTSYKFYVTATDLTTSSFVKKSNETECTTTTGLKGIYVVESTSATPGNLTTSTLIPLTDNESYTYTVTDTKKYIHIQAVDHAGNLSTIKTLTPIPTISYGATNHCAFGTVSVTLDPSTVAGTYSVTPAGLSLNSANGTIDLAASTPGTYTVTYNCETHGCPKPTATVIISALPVVTVTNAQANEGDNLSFVVELTGGHCSLSNATVAFATFNGTATAPADYTATSGTLTFAPGETKKTITVPTVGNDNLVEGDELMYLDLSLPVSCKLSGNVATLRATGTIKDMTDGAIIVEKFKPASKDASEPSTDGSFLIRFGTGITCTKDVTVNYKLKGAVNPTDYTITVVPNVTGTTATIKQGSNGIEIPIAVTNNYIVQGHRELEIEITSIAP